VLTVLCGTEIWLSVRVSVAHSVRRLAVGWTKMIQMLAVVFGFSTLPVFLLTAVVYAQSSIQWVRSSISKLLKH
jgi:hypothetical protein